MTPVTTLYSTVSLFTELVHLTNLNTLGPRVIQISEKFGLVGILINVEPQKTLTDDEYHYGTFVRVRIKGIWISEGLLYLKKPTGYLLAKYLVQ